MRQRGLAKTPDVLLETPIAVKDPDGRWHVVTWIDSKALFGYRDSFQDQVSAQVLPYVCKGYLMPMPAD